MNSRTHVIELEVSAEVAYAFLSEIDNLPKWATVFCRALTKSDDGLHRIDTPQGPMLFRIDADRSSGVVDMHGGPAAHQMVYWPARVVTLGPDRSAFLFTMFQWPGITDESFEAQSRALSGEMQNINAILEGGETRNAA